MPDLFDLTGLFYERSGIILALKEYLLSVTAAALVCALVRRLLAGKGSAEAMGKILAGIFMILTALTPLTQFRLPELLELPFSGDSQAAVAHGEELAQKELAAGISDRVEAYILEKAAAMGAYLTVDVVLSHDPIPVPVKVCLQGSISPYARQKLQTMIQTDLGINKENQVWT